MKHIFYILPHPQTFTYYLVYATSNTFPGEQTQQLSAHCQHLGEPAVELAIQKKEKKKIVPKQCDK